MSEVRINIEEQHLLAFLNFLKTLNYVQIREVLAASTSRRESTTAVSHLDDTAYTDASWRAVIKPLRTTVTADELIREQQYQKTDWQHLKSVAKDMDIQEPVEELLAQLAANDLPRITILPTLPDILRLGNH